MIKDIGYIIRSPLLLACIVACIWHGSKGGKYSDTSTLIGLSLFFSPLISLAITYIVQKLTNKVLPLETWGKLPRETKYGAFCIFISTASLSDSKPLLSLINLIIIISLSVWANLGSSLIEGGLTNFFRKSLVTTELSVSLCIISWFLMLAVIHWIESPLLGTLIGFIVGLTALLIFPFITAWIALLIQFIYLKIDHKFFLMDNDYKIYGINRIEGNPNEDLIQFYEAKKNSNITTSKLKIAERLIDYITQLSSLSKRIEKQDFDNNKIEFGESFASYERWKIEIEEFIRTEISIEEADNFKNLYVQGSKVLKNLKTYTKEINFQIIPFLKSLTEAVLQENFIIKTKSMKHTRYRVLKKIFEKAPHNGVGNISISNLQSYLNDISTEEINDILEYWIREKLIEKVNDNVKLTPFGLDEIKSTINKPDEATAHFPANIYNDYSTHYNMRVGSAGSGAIFQQGVSNSSATSTVNFTTAGSEATTKLIELIKESPLRELDKEEATINLKRIQELSEQEKTPEVKESAIKRIELVKKILEVAKEAGGLVTKAAPYFTTLLQFFR